MQKLGNHNDSDDDFQDALTDVTNKSPKTEESQNDNVAIAELIQKQNELKLPDDEEERDENRLKGGASEDGVGTQPEHLDDVIAEDELREREKSMSEEELLLNKEEADKMKLEGNELFKNDDSEQSIAVYTEALKICPTRYTKERAILYGNRAAAKIKLDSKRSAIEDCSRAIELWPEYVRALLRRAKLFEHEDKLEEALEDYKRVNELDAGQREAREAMVRLPPIINERNERLKEEMMSKLKDLGNMILKPFGLSTSNFQMQQDPSSGSYSINFNQNSKS